MSALAVSALSVSLSGRAVLRDISLTLGAGEFVGLIGPNGAGKSTLIRAVLGLVPSTGAIRLDGQPLSSLEASARARSIAYIAQGRDVAWPMAVETLVALGRTPHLGPFTPLGPTDRAAVDDALDRMDLQAFRHRPATELSGGELARVLIARALAQEAPVLLADEPTAGLDPSHQITLMRLFETMAREGRTILASTHDLSLAARYCTRLILLRDGKIVADGSVTDVLTPQNLEDVYGVRAFIGEADGRLLLQPFDLA